MKGIRSPILSQSGKMKYFICSVCSAYHKVRNDRAFKCCYCDSEKGAELTKREYEGKPK